jgi:hypothetical protein
MTARPQAANDEAGGLPEPAVDDPAVSGEAEAAARFAAAWSAGATGD